MGSGRSGWRSGCWHRRSCGSTLSWESSGLWMGPNRTSSPRHIPDTVTEILWGERGRKSVSTGWPAGLGASGGLASPPSLCLGCGALRTLFPPFPSYLWEDFPSHRFRSRGRVGHMPQGHFRVVRSSGRGAMVNNIKSHAERVIPFRVLSSPLYSHSAQSCAGFPLSSQSGHVHLDWAKGQVQIMGMWFQGSS